MSDVQHTPEPWSTAYRERRDGQWAQEIFDETGELIATLAWYSVKEGRSTRTNREANARRIVACINALKGVTTEGLEEAVAMGITDVTTGNLFSSRLKLTRERDEARAMVAEQSEFLKDVRDYLTDALSELGDEGRPRYERRRQLIRDDIAKLDAMTDKAEAIHA